ncbi:MAG: metal ABC transporter ATP-binding protein [Gemmataceae bacterium]
MRPDSSGDYPALSMLDVGVAYHGRAVLEQATVEIDGPALVAIVGPNGAGKSTLLKAALGLLPHTGIVRILGQPVEAVRRRIGYIPQRSSVDWDFPVSVLDVALMGTYGRLGWFRRPGRAEYQLARECLRRVGLQELESRQIGQLSGGQQQRVFLARALAQQADIYFMDEPMAGVDAATEAELFQVLEALRDQGKTLFVVHHDLRSVPEHFDQVILLQQRVIAAGPVATTFTAALLQEAYGGRVVALQEGMLTP